MGTFPPFSYKYVSRKHVPLPPPGPALTSIRKTEQSRRMSYNGWGWDGSYLPGSASTSRRTLDDPHVPLPPPGQALTSKRKTDHDKDWDKPHEPHQFGYSVHMEKKEKRHKCDESSRPKDGSPIIMRLNDDCLRDIFSKVSLKDLVLNVRAWCSRFRRLADEEMPRKFRDEEFVCSNTKIAPIFRLYQSRECMKCM